MPIWAMTSKAIEFYEQALVIDREIGVPIEGIESWQY